jgi:hypothetical protein
MRSTILEARFPTLLIAVSIASTGCGAGSRPAEATTRSSSVSNRGGADFSLRTTVAIPGAPLKAFDISWVDAGTRRYYLADRSNAGVDVVDTRTSSFVGRIQGDFAGADPRGNDFSGPNGVVVIHDAERVRHAGRSAPGKKMESDDGESDQDKGGSRSSVHELWAGDGPRVLHAGEAPQSSVKVFNLDSTPPTLVATIPTGGSRRSDEMAHDPRHHLLAVVNNADDPPFLSLISTRPPRNVVVRITFAPGGPHYPFKNAVTGGLEQPRWVPKTGRFYVSVPELDGDATKGAIAVIDPVAQMVTDLLPVSNCQPAGLELGPRQQLLIGCADPSRSIVLDATTGDIVAIITEVGGSDEVWFNPGDERYYLAARNDPSGPSLGIIDAGTNAFVGKVPTAFNAHSVAADPRNNHVFVPLTPPRSGKSDPDPCVKSGGPTFTGRGCIGVYWGSGAEDHDEG